MSEKGHVRGALPSEFTSEFRQFGSLYDNLKLGVGIPGFRAFRKIKVGISDNFKAACRIPTSFEPRLGIPSLKGRLSRNSEAEMAHSDYSEHLTTLGRNVGNSDFFSRNLTGNAALFSTRTIIADRYESITGHHDPFILSQGGKIKSRIKQELESLNGLVQLFGA